ncbi:Uncharacterised protein [Mycobacterium tuberculosis]|nr:Uncharacterised protein [Mycobacterium tuberculosis]COX36707.1 Uncharacterised protein [Mycobacterium tuberculosis]
MSLSPPSSLLLYTFQLMPASLRFCGMMRQVKVNFGWMAGSTICGPP